MVFVFTKNIIKDPHNGARVHQKRFKDPHSSARDYQRTTIFFIYLSCKGARRSRGSDPPRSPYPVARSGPLGSM